jgi:hypothetical protein
LAFLDLLFQAAEANPDLNDKAIRNEIFLFMGGVSIIAASTTSQILLTYSMIIFK